MSESETYVHPDQWMVIIFQNCIIFLKFFDNGKLIIIFFENFQQIKPYSFYKDEYFECRNWRSRFNQYFIFGHFLDCSASYNDKQNSKLWESKKDLKALVSMTNIKVLKKNH